MKSEKEIRERIRKLDKFGRKKFNPKNDKEATKTLIKAYIKLGERYSLWWVLGEVHKYQKKQLKISEAKKMTYSQINQHKCWGFSRRTPNLNNVYGDKTGQTKIGDFCGN